jgi:heme exporter protein A
MMSAQELSLLRGDRCLFRDLEFALQPGELLMVEGPNGSGKTSLLRGIAGLLEFETGYVEWRARPVHEHYQAFRGDLVWFAHRVGFKSDLNLVENLGFEAALRATDPDALAGVLERLGLTRLVSLPFRSLSAGQQRRVALARMLLSRAVLWMMDEPFTNLDRSGHDLVVELIGEHLERGGLAIVASHQHLSVEGRTKRVLIQ